jgi:hypothetical protein
MEPNTLKKVYRWTEEKKSVDGLCAKTSEAIHEESLGTLGQGIECLMFESN